MKPRPAANLVVALWLTLWIVSGHSVVAVEPGAGERPAEGLLRLVPPDAAVVLTVEGLRDQARAFGESRLFADLRKLPAVRDWLDSEKYRQFEQSRAKVEALLGANLTDLRDDILGDAVVLALRLPSGPAQEPRGLVLIRARDPALSRRVIRIINATQKESGELSQVVEHLRAGMTYHVREFPAAANRPSESYVTYSDGTMAMSNSEPLIQAVIDRKEAKRDVEPGLADLPKFQSVRRLLPEKALVRLFVDPRRVEGLIAAAPGSTKASDARLKPMLERYITAVDYAGAAFAWSDRALVIHAVEMLDPSKLDPWIVRLSHDARPVNPGLGRVPPTALAVASAHVDAVAFRDALTLIVPDDDQPRLTNIDTVLTGLLLGQDLQTRVLPRVGPGVFGYFDPPPEAGPGPSGTGPASRRSWPFPPVLVVSLGGAADAVENALRTVLALTALDDKRAQGRSRIVTRNVAGATVTTLDPPSAFAFAVDRAGDRLVVSSSADSVARYLESLSDAKAGQRFERLRAMAVPEAETFLLVDLDALNGLADRNRELLAQTIATRQNRPLADVKRDLDQVLNLARLFEAAFVSSRIDPEAKSVHHSAGLILHDPGAK